MQIQAVGLVFASLLKETILRIGVEREEGEMRDLAYLADTEDGAEHFKRLTDFRRILARLHQSLGDAQGAFKISVKAELHARGLVLLRGAKTLKQTATSIPGEAAEDSAKPQQPANFNRTHLESLQSLQERLNAIKEELNEEIQLAIGSVQVHDARTMKKQTTWTMMLTMPAAIYLPMTLVTDIFGMNITEISSGATAPDVWWAFGAWAVVFAVTLVGILLYAVVRKWKARNKRKRKVDLEANYMSKVHVGRTKPSENAVLVIDDIDDEWCEALCTIYPHAINRKFLLEHILGLESARRAKDTHDRLSLEPQPELSEVVDLDTLDRMFPCLMNAY